MTDDVVTCSGTRRHKRGPKEGRTVCGYRIWTQAIPLPSMPPCPKCFRVDMVIPTIEGRRSSAQYPIDTQDRAKQVARLNLYPKETT